MITTQEFTPSPLLQEFVRFYHYTETRLEGATLFKPLPARPEQFLQFSFREHYTIIDRATGTTGMAPPVVVVGRQTQRKIDLLATGDVLTFTIHFQPTGFYRLFHIPLPELTNLTPNAADVIGGDIRVLYERLQEAPSPQAKVSLAESYLLKKMRSVQSYHPVQTAAAAIQNHRGQVSVAALATACNLGLRQFERVFAEAVGVQPKQYCRIVRFAHVLELKNKGPHRSWTEVAYEAGYFDQMHLIRDCKAFADETPSALVQTWLPCRQ